MHFEKVIETIFILSYKLLLVKKPDAQSSKKKKKIIFLQPKLTDLCNFETCKFVGFNM